jgi:hypothetical protein
MKTAFMIFQRYRQNISLFSLRIAECGLRNIGTLVWVTIAGFIGKSL